MKKLKDSVVALIASMMLACAAQAVEIGGVVDSWLLEISTGYDMSSVQWEAGGTPGTVVDEKTLQWGSGRNGPSSLVIGSDSSATVHTDGAAVANLSVTHTNNTIRRGSGELASANIISMLTLTPDVPGAAPIEFAAVGFSVLFEETLNAPSTCVDGTKNGSGVNANGCADIVVIEPTELTVPFSYDLGDGPVNYLISLFDVSNALTALSSDACEAAGAQSRCTGLLTPEQDATAVLFAAMISSVPIGPSQTVPAPSAFILAAAGLLGLSVLRRRRRA